MDSAIVAIATPCEKGSAVGVIRMSGEGALRIAKQMFCARGFDSDNIEPYRMYLGTVNTERFSDKAFCMYCKAPKSYTGEDVIEFQAHGGKVILDGILRECVKLGARPAEPGEFTKRAYLNGKLDLAEAEGIQDMITATSEAAANQAYRLMTGEVSRGIELAKEDLLSASAELECALDYPEEIGEDAAEPTAEYLRSAHARLTELYKASLDARVTREGLSVVLAGLTNVGKSSVMNALLRDDRAIVTDVAGTTRDVLKGEIELEGVKIELSDTAGIRESDDPVERIGIERATRAVEGADLVLFVTDLSEETTPQEKALYDTVKHKKHIVVANKEDVRKFDKPSDIVISAGKNKNINGLRALIVEKLDLKRRVAQPALTRERQIFAVKSALEHIENALDGIRQATFDCVAVDVRLAYTELASLTGEDVAETVVNEIFSRFCVGK